MIKIQIYILRNVGNVIKKISTILSNNILFKRKGNAECVESANDDTNDLGAKNIWHLPL